jgi:hypothetical protein
MSLLRTIQREFRLSLLDRDREAPACVRGSVRGERRFDVHRNNAGASLTEALAARFPVCVALVGSEFFHGTARAFVELCPPRSPVLMDYGDNFGDFIDTFPPARALPYLGDLARLEAARTRAYHAADADPLGPEELALPPCAWDETRARLHPSLQIVRSAYSIVSIWEAHQAGGTRSEVDASAPEDALVVRPNQEVEVHRLPPGGAVFALKLLDGATFRDAARKGAASDRDFDLVTALTALLIARVFVELSPAACPLPRVP